MNENYAPSHADFGYRVNVYAAAVMKATREGRRPRVSRLRLAACMGRGANPSLITRMEDPHAPSLTVATVLAYCRCVHIDPCGLLEEACSLYHRIGVEPSLPVRVGNLLPVASDEDRLVGLRLEAIPPVLGSLLIRERHQAQRSLGDVAAWINATSVMVKHIEAADVPIHFRLSTFCAYCDALALQPADLVREAIDIVRPP